MASRLLRRNDHSVAEVAQRVGYSSGNTRYVGLSPTRYAQEQRQPVATAMDVA
jgi:AraC-like DNA-binding protein